MLFKAGKCYLKQAAATIFAPIFHVYLSSRCRLSEKFLGHSWYSWSLDWIQWIPFDRDSNFARCIFLLSCWPDGGMGIILKPTPGSRIDYFFRKTMFTYLPLAGICLGCIKFSFVWELLHLQRVFLKVPNLDFSNLPTWISQTCQPGFLLQPAATAPACAGHIAPGQEGILQGIREI